MGIAFTDKLGMKFSSLVLGGFFAVVLVASVEAQASPVNSTHEQGAAERKGIVDEANHGSGQAQAASPTAVSQMTDDDRAFLQNRCNPAAGTCLPSSGRGGQPAAPITQSAPPGSNLGVVRDYNTLSNYYGAVCPQGNRTELCAALFSIGKLMENQRSSNSTPEESSLARIASVFLGRCATNQNAQCTALFQDVSKAIPPALLSALNEASRPVPQTVGPRPSYDLGAVAADIPYLMDWNARTLSWRDGLTFNWKLKAATLGGKPLASTAQAQQRLERAGLVFGPEQGF